MDTRANRNQDKKKTEMSIRKEKTPAETANRGNANFWESAVVYNRVRARPMLGTAKGPAVAI